MAVTPQKLGRRTLAVASFLSRDADGAINLLIRGFVGKYALTVFPGLAYFFPTVGKTRANI